MESERLLRIGVIGSGDATLHERAIATRVGAAIARASAITVCGGMGGVMAAAADGARSMGGIVVGLLPGTDPELAADGVTIPIPTGMGEARNVLVVRASEAVIAIGGEWGTLSEAAFCRKFGTPVVGCETKLPNGVVDEEISDVERCVDRVLVLAKGRRGRRTK